MLIYSIVQCCDCKNYMRVVVVYLDMVRLQYIFKMYLKKNIFLTGLIILYFMPKDYCLCTQLIYRVIHSTLYFSHVYFYFSALKTGRFLGECLVPRVTRFFGQDFVRLTVNTGRLLHPGVVVMNSTCFYRMMLA